MQQIALYTNSLVLEKIKTLIEIAVLYANLQAPNHSSFVFKIEFFRK